MLRNVYVGRSAEKTVEYRVEDVKLYRLQARIKIRGVDDRTAARRFAGSYIFVEEKSVEIPRTGEYFIHDIVGCSVRSKDGRQWGIVENVYKLPAQDVWAVRSESKVHLVPAVNEFVKKVDIKNREIIIEAIEGLIEE